MNASAFLLQTLHLGAGLFCNVNMLASLPGPKPQEHVDDNRARVLDTDELIDFLQARTQETVDQHRSTSPEAYQVLCIAFQCL